MDADRDGKVTAAEMDAAHEQITGQKAGKDELSAMDKINAVDPDGDGILTSDEHAAASRKMFQKMDTNQDDLLTSAELEAGHAKMMRKAGK
jgi:Ca2+-binding EF-hand superfamily protein